MAQLPSIDLPDLIVIAADLHETVVQLALMAANLHTNSFASDADITAALDQARDQSRMVRGQAKRFNQAIDTHKTHWRTRKQEAAE